MKKTQLNFYNTKLFYLFGRSVFLYLMVGMILFITINHQKIVFKTLDYLQFVPVHLAEFAKNQNGHLSTLRANQSIRYYKNFVRLFPQSATGYEAIGFCYYSLNRFDKAIYYFEKADKFQHNLFGLHYNLGIIYYLNNNYQKAVQYFTKAVQSTPQETLSYPIMINPFHQKVDNLTTSNNGSARIMALKKAYTHSYEYINLLENQLLKKSHNDLHENVLLSRNLFYYQPMFTRDDLRRLLH